MKIGVLTFANVSNFGANIQALSTISFLRNKGHEAYIIDWSPKDFQMRFQNFSSPQQFAHRDFFQTMIPHTRKVCSDDEIADLLQNDNFEAVIVGSDAVLQDFPFLSRFHFPTRTIYRIDPITSDRMFPNAFWGSFLSKMDFRIPVAIMSGSCQNCKYKNIFPNQRKKMREALEEFSYISVRDEWTKKMLAYISSSDVEAPITPDPVFAFNQNYPQNIDRTALIKKFNLPNKYVLFSFKKPENISYDWLCQIKQLFKNEGYDCVAFPMPDGLVFKHPFDFEVQTPLNPLDWYNLIRMSNGYIGENMHPIVVCLHNSTPVFSFDSYGAKRFRFFVDEKSSKVYDVMKIFGLADNRIRVKKYIKPEDVVNKILHFDFGHCGEIASNRYNDYINMMDNLMNSFK